MNTEIKIAIIGTFVGIWFLCSYLIVLYNKRINEIVSKEWDYSSWKRLFIFKLGIEGPFVLLRLLIRK